jgi:hypothetical protein
MVGFMKSFARSRNLDPLIPETWYTIPIDDIRQTKVCHPLGKWVGVLLIILGWECNLEEIQQWLF